MCFRSLNFAVFPTEGATPRLLYTPPFPPLPLCVCAPVLFTHSAPTSQKKKLQQNTHTDTFYEYNFEFSSRSCRRTNFKIDSFKTNKTNSPQQKTYHDSCRILALLASLCEGVHSLVVVCQGPNKNKTLHSAVCGCDSCPSVSE